MTRTDLAMNPAEYQSLLSERSSLERMIADTPPDEVIDLRSLQVRLEIVNDQLAAQPKETRLKEESEMSDAPTPETDKAEDSDPMVEGEWHWIVPSSFARRLERERDSALEELARVRKELAASNRGAETNAKVNQGLCSRLTEAERERDEARRALEWISKRYCYEKTTSQLAVEAYEMFSMARWTLQGMTLEEGA